MFNFNELWTRARHFFQVGIWNVNQNAAAGWGLYILKPLRILVLTVQGFVVDKSGLQASALTFYTLFAVVPVMAVLFGLAQGFGLDQHLEKWLYLNLAGREEIVSQFVSISRRLLENTRGGLIAGISVVLLFWSALKVLGRVEAILNQIWKVASRSVIRKFTDYLTILIFGPLFVIVASSMNIYITAHMAAFSHAVPFLRAASPVVLILLKLVPYTLIWVVFVLTYVVIPNTRVKLISAVIGGVVAGAVFQVVQGGYLSAQVLLSRHNALYGSFAALPLLLIWMQVSWIILLLGAQLTYAHQHVEHYAGAQDYRRISLNLQRKYALYVFHALVRRFENATSPLTMSELAQQLGLPYGLVVRIVDALQGCGMISAVIIDSQEGIGYQPARDIHAIRVADLLQAMDRAGDDSLPENHTPDLTRISDAVEALTQSICQAPADRLVKEI